MKFSEIDSWQDLLKWLVGTPWNLVAMVVLAVIVVAGSFGWALAFAVIYGAISGIWLGILDRRAR